MFILIQTLFRLLFFVSVTLTADFLPDTTDSDAYGLKVAANNLMFVAAGNDYTNFLIQFGPYTDNITQTSERTCFVEYDDPSRYIYALALGKNQSTYRFFFVGEMYGWDDQAPLVNRTFIGVVTYMGSLTDIDCENGFTFDVQYILDAFAHQEHLVITADPSGSTVYGFSNLFTFSYTVSSNNLIVHPNNSLSPSTSFLPFAVEYDGNRGIIAGFLDNGRNSRIKYRAMVILFNVNASNAIATPIDSWSYPTNGTTWQARQTNAYVEEYIPRYTMSVSMNPIVAQVLVGIQSMNTVFLFNYTMTSLVLVTSIDNGQGIGFGKGVAWLSGDSPTSLAILVNVYSISYVWSSSKIYIYDNGLTNTSTPISIFPNIQQPLYSYISSVFLNIITTPNHLVLQDNRGGLLVILASPIGWYSSTVGPPEEIVPAFSSQLACIPGTYKNVTGIGRCLPCPMGTSSNGTNLQRTACVACANNTFCPLGSSSDTISNDLLRNVSQALAYPKSPDVTELDDILFLTLFSLSSTARCLVISPIFWTLIVAAIVVLIGILMFVMKYFIKHPAAANRYKMLTNVFKRTDLIGEGDMWIGGLVTFCVLVLVISCFIFSANYYNSYPIETTGPSTYTCDTSTRNAKFTSTLQSSLVPVSSDFQAMVDLLNEQEVNLNVALINTVYNCTLDTITLTYLLGQTWAPVRTNISCNSSNYILSLSARLPYREITVRFTLSNIYTIGGLRVGLSAPGQVRSSTTLHDLNFSQTFSQQERMLAQNVNIALQLTKVINDTTPLTTDGEDKLSGLWIGSFTLNYYESFLTAVDYLNALAETSASLTITVSETPYYILNRQEPITKLSELVFHNFLFTTMIIELFGLAFLICKLAIIPLLTLIIRKCKPKFAETCHQTDTRGRASSSTRNHYKESISDQKRPESTKDDSNMSGPLHRSIFHISEGANTGLPSNQFRQAYL